MCISNDFALPIFLSFILFNACIFHKKAGRSLKEYWVTMLEKALFLLISWFPGHRLRKRGVFRWELCKWMCLNWTLIVDCCVEVYVYVYVLYVYVYVFVFVSLSYVVLTWGLRWLLPSCFSLLSLLCNAVGGVVSHQGRGEGQRPREGKDKNHWKIHTHIHMGFLLLQKFSLSRPQLNSTLSIYSNSSSQMP